VFVHITALSTVKLENLDAQFKHCNGIYSYVGEYKEYPYFRMKHLYLFIHQIVHNIMYWWICDMLGINKPTKLYVIISWKTTTSALFHNAWVCVNNDCNFDPKMHRCQLPAEIFRKMNATIAYASMC